MPTVLLMHGLRFGFFANEGAEPPHVHVSKAGAVGKWWLRPLKPVYYHGFSPTELRTIRRVLATHQRFLLEQWHDFFEL